MGKKKELKVNKLLKPFIIKRKDFLKRQLKTPLVRFNIILDVTNTRPLKLSEGDIRAIFEKGEEPQIFKATTISRYMASAGAFRIPQAGESFFMEVLMACCPCDDLSPEEKIVMEEFEVWIDEEKRSVERAFDFVITDVIEFEVSKVSSVIMTDFHKGTGVLFQDVDIFVKVAPKASEIPEETVH